MVDAPALFFSVLAVRLTIGFDHACSPGRLALTRTRARGKVGAAAAIGAALALAVSSKFNALAVVAACAAILLVDAAAGGGLKARAAVAGVAAIVATAVFIALNPYLYADPLGRTWSMLSYQHNQPAITGVAERVLLVLRRLLAGEIDPQGLSYLTIRSMIRLPLEWVLFPVALVSAARALLREISGKVSRAAGGTIDENRSGAATSVLIWWIITTAAVAAWLPQDWERYYLPALPPTVLLSARGLDKAIGWALPLFRGIWLRPAGAS